MFNALPHYALRSLAVASVSELKLYALPLCVLSLYSTHSRSTLCALSPTLRTPGLRTLNISSLSKPRRKKRDPQQRAAGLQVYIFKKGVEFQYRPRTLKPDENQMSFWLQMIPICYRHAALFFLDRNINVHLDELILWMGYSAHHTIRTPRHLHAHSRNEGTILRKWTSTCSEWMQQTGPESPSVS